MKRIIADPQFCPNKSGRFAGASCRLIQNRTRANYRL